MGSYSTAQMGSRRRLLHTCGVSFTEIVHRAYIRAQGFHDGPFCSITEKIARIGMLTSLVHFIVQYHSHLLTILSLLDDQILALENSVEGIFPPSKHLFDMVDKLAQIAEAFPSKVDRASACAIAWLNFWLSILGYRRLENSKEKDIVIVDISCDDSVVGETSDVIRQAKEDGIDENLLGGGASEGTCEDGLKKAKKVTYKEVLENGRKKEKCYRKNRRNSDVIIREENDNIEWLEDGKKGRKKDTEKEEIWAEGCGKARRGDVRIVEKGNKRAKKSGQGRGDAKTEGINAGGDEMQGQVGQDDAILALFESAWLMKAGDRGKERLMARCASYQW